VKRRTYSHLEGQKKIPDEYDIATSRLLYYVERGFAVNATASRWYDVHQRGSALTSPDWESFADPRRTTYSRYVALQRDREARADGIVHAMEQPGYNELLSPAWSAVLLRLLGPLRYPLHGFQMAASYIGSMAPAGRVVITSLFQAADEMRRIQRVTQRMVQLSRTEPRFTTEAKSTWMSDAAWQKLRALVERVLVTYDWGEALVALNTCVKPVVDRMVNDSVADAALRAGDALLASLLRNLNEDSLWQRDWTRSLLLQAVQTEPKNRDMIARVTGEWLPRVTEAVAPLAFALGDGTKDGTKDGAKDALRDVERLARDDIAALLSGAA
jgi:toluene monooxygenase system protein E